MKYEIFFNEKYQDLNPVLFGYENCKPLHFSSTAIRAYWIIHFVVSGHGRFQINKKEYTLGKNNIFVIPPYVETYYEADESEPWTYIWIAFTVSDNISINLPDIMHCPELRNTFLSMKNCEKYENTQVPFICSKLWEIYAHLHQTAKPHSNYINTALTYINYQYMNNITAESIAKYLNLERTYFSALFKKHTGLSPKQYLINYRMNIATKLLTMSTSSISCIASSVGYTDIYNFSKMFKQHYGVSPKEYRKMAISKTKEAQNYNTVINQNNFLLP